MPIASRLELAIEIARRAGKLTLEHFQRGIDFERKADDSPVTVADRAAEQLLREAVRHAFPDDAIIGEEFGEHEGSSGYTWIFDPIDGTKSFISGVPLYGTMVGVQHEGRCPIGVVYIPGLDEMLAKFSKEHTHTEDEVRFTVKGAGVFHIHPENGPVFAVQVESGDLIYVPAGTKHWFDLCSDRTIRCIRLFLDPAGWSPHYVDQPVNENYEPVCWGPNYMPAEGGDMDSVVKL